MTPSIAAASVHGASDQGAAHPDDLPEVNRETTEELVLTHHARERVRIRSGESFRS